MEGNPSGQSQDRRGLPEFVGETPAEFDFHQRRFEAMAKKYEKSLVKRILNWNAKMSAKDFAHAEALRDDADFERRKDAEFQAWERNFKTVARRLLEKRDGTQEGKDVRALLLILGGGVKGASGAGQALLGLPAVGLDKVFDTVVGISAGAATAAYLVGGGAQAAKGASIFYEECMGKEFINPRRARQVMNIDVVTQAMSRGEKAVDQRAVQESKTELYFGVTREKDGQCELMNAKTAKPGMIAAVGASMAVPLLYGKAIEVNDEKYVDGIFDPMPIERILEQFSPTDVLILPNTPFERMDAFELAPGEYLFAEIASHLGPLSRAGKLLRVKEEIRKSLDYIQNQHDVHIGVLWPPDSGLGNLTADADKVEAAVVESARGVIEAFGARQPGKLDVFHSHTR